MSTFPDQITDPGSTVNRNC